MEPHNEPLYYPESARINVLNDQQVAFWTKQFGITEQQLRNAVFISGPIVKEVKDYLSRHGLLGSNQSEQL